LRGPAEGLLSVFTPVCESYDSVPGTWTDYIRVPARAAHLLAAIPDPETLENAHARMNERLKDSACTNMKG
jgi:hypothetical protein